MPKWFKWTLPLVFLYLLRLGFGLGVKPVQPMEDELQTYLLGLKYFTTGLWPYYGNDVLAPGYVEVTQDPGPLEALVIGLPLKVWPSPLSPFILLNLLTFAGHCFLAYYASKRLPRLPAWFIFPWVLAAPWFIHYSTGMMNFSYSIAAADLFFVAFLETIPALSLKWIPLPLAGLLMGFSLSVLVQFHRTWVLLPVLVLFSFYEQGRRQPPWKAPFYFLLGALPLSLLILPAFFQPGYHLSRETAGLSSGFNFHNFLMFFVVLAQYLIMAGFEMARFIGGHTADRMRFLAQSPLLWPGFFLWIFGFAQVFLYLGYLFVPRADRPDWRPLRFLLLLVFILVYGSLLFTVKTPDINTFCEMMPVVMLYSLTLWEQWWQWPWGKPFLIFSLASLLVFQAGYVFIQWPRKESFYLRYQDAIGRAVGQHDFLLLGERRKGSLY